MSVVSPWFPLFWDALGWTMLHFLWVGALVALVARLVLWTVRRRSGQVRYAVAFAGFLLLALTPAVLCAWKMADPAPVASITEGIDIPRHAGERIVDATASFRQPSVANTQEEKPAIAKPVQPTGALGRAVSDTASSAGAADASPPRLRLWIGDGVQRTVGQSYGFALRMLPWLWVCGFPLACAWILLGVTGTERLRRACRPLDNEEWLSLCRRLEQQLRIRILVRFAVSDRLAVPLLIGIVRPLVLLPASALSGYSPEQVEMIVLHELAHVRRWDNLVNLLQRLVEAVLFFHPSVWWLSRRVRLEREHCCDAIVLAHTGSPRRYAEFLAHLALPGVLPQGALGVSAGEQLVARIRHILNQENESMKVSRSSVIATSAFFLALIAIATTWAHLKPSAVAAEMEVVHRIPPLEGEIRDPKPIQEPGAAAPRPFGMAVAQASSPRDHDAEPAKSRPVPSASAASSRGRAKTLAEPAVVRAFETASLYARINGTVEKVDVDAGDRVKAGQLLVEIAAPEVKADMDVNHAKLDEAAGQLQQAQLALAPVDVRLQAAQKQYREHVVSAAEVSLAEARRDIAQAAITIAKARLQVANMELRKAESLFDYTRVRAPFDGIVTSRNVSVGDSLFAGSGAASRPLVVIERTDRVRVIVRVPEQYVLQVEPGCPATVALDALPGKPYSAKVTRTSGFLSPGTRNMPVEIDLPNPNGQLMSGMYGRATITLKTPSQQK